MKLKIKGNKRLENESFKGYRKRLKKENLRIKEHLKGSCFWLSSTFGTFDIRRNKYKFAMRNGYQP